MSDDLYNLNPRELEELFEDTFETRSSRTIGDVLFMLNNRGFYYWEIRNQIDEEPGAVVQKRYTDGISTARGATERIALMRAAIIAERKNDEA